MWHNWRLIEPHAVDPMRVENLRLLTPIWDYLQMESFMLVVLEMHARAAPSSAQSRAPRSIAGAATTQP